MMLVELALLGFTAGPTTIARAPSVKMALVDDFAISKVVKDVRIFDGDYAAEIRTEVIDAATACIATKGSFSIAVPGGSVVAALGGLEKDAFDFSKMHVFFCNEKIPTFPCVEGALAETAKFGLPAENVHGVGEGSPAEIAERCEYLRHTSRCP